MRLTEWDDATVAHYRKLWEGANAAHIGPLFISVKASKKERAKARRRWRVLYALASLLSTQPPILPPERLLRNSIRAHCEAAGQPLHESAGSKGGKTAATPIPSPPSVEEQLSLWSDVDKNAKSIEEKHGAIERLAPLLGQFRSLTAPTEGQLTELWVEAIQFIRKEPANPVPAGLLWHFDGEQNRKSAYHTFSLPKRRGGARKIEAPSGSLKWVQRSLLQVLTHLFPRHKCAMGFERGKNVVTHAKAHIGKRWVYVVDIKDFFPSITRNRVFGMLRAFPFKASKHVARYLANLTTIDGALPQGAPTSPILGNLLCRRLDSRLFKWARERGYTYTRYADDLVFSTNRNDFPEEDRAKIVEIIEDEGFHVHPDKERLMPWHGRQLVTGLVVNEKPNVPRERIRGLRALLFNVDKFGWKSQVGRGQLFTEDDKEWKQYKRRTLPLEEFQEYKEKQEEEHLLVRPGSAIPQARSVRRLQQVVQGRIEFVGMVKGKDSKVYRRLLEKYQRLVGRRRKFEEDQRIGEREYEPEQLSELEAKHPEQTRYYAEVKDLLRSINRDDKTLQDLWSWIEARADHSLEATWLLKKLPTLEPDVMRREARALAFALDTNPHETALFFREFGKDRPFRRLLHAPQSTTEEGKFFFGKGEPLTAGQLIGQCKRTLRRRMLPNRLQTETRKVLNECESWLEVHPAEHPYTAEPVKKRLRTYKREVRFDDEPGLDLRDRLQDLIESVEKQGCPVEVQERCDVFYTYTPAVLDGIGILLKSLAEKAVQKSEGESVPPVTVETEWERIGGWDQVKVRLQAHDGPVGVRPKLRNLLRGDAQRALDHLRGFARWTIEAPFGGGDVHAFDVTQNTKVDPTREELPGFLHELTFYQ